MNIFNSLGSNYDLTFAIRARLLRGNNADLKKLTDFLSEKYQGTAYLTYKGRDALFFALKAANLPEKSHVAINGFTCFAVYKAVVDTGHIPTLLDIDQDRLHFSAFSLEKNIKAVVIQNTLGIPSEIEKISAWCKKNDAILIEDLAHSVGATYENKKEAGMIGDMVTFSFSQDKLIDAVSGGALVIRNKKFQQFHVDDLKNHSLWRSIKDRTYPMHTLEIKNLYPFGIGKLLHHYLKMIDILPKPVESESNMYEMHSWQARLALEQLHDLDSNLQHRKTLAKIYAEKLDRTVTSKKINSLVNHSSNLRFPIFVKNRNTLIQFLKTKGIYISDIWYDAPISPKRYIKEIQYNGDCKNTEEISETILNLPTHRNVSEDNASKISSLINSWLQQKN